MPKIKDGEVTQFTPTAEEMVPDQGPQKTAESYADRVSRREAVNNLKGKGLPLGGAPPIPEGKLKGLLPDTMPKPDFGEMPEEVAKDEEFAIPPTPQHIEGVGSSYAVNQAMARGDVDGPISMAEAKRQGIGGQAKPSTISKESVEALNATKEVIESGATQSKLDDVEQGFIDNSKEKSSTDVPFDLQEIFRQQDILTNDARRKDIEGRLPELSIEDMIVKRELTQTIPVIPGKLEFMLRTFSQKEFIWVLGYLYEFPGSTVHNEQLLNTFKIVLSVVALNGQRLPDHRRDIGTGKEEVDRELFERKMHHIASLPVQLIADVGVQCNWFNERVNKLFTYENVKNG